jgi:hypothetical protein
MSEGSRKEKKRKEMSMMYLSRSTDVSATSQRAFLNEVVSGRLAHGDAGEKVKGHEGMVVVGGRKVFERL